MTVHPNGIPMQEENFATFCEVYLDDAVSWRLCIHHVTKGGYFGKRYVNQYIKINISHIDSYSLIYVYLSQCIQIQDRKVNIVKSIFTVKKKEADMCNNESHYKCLLMLMFSVTLS